MSAFNKDLTVDQKILEWSGNANALAKLKVLEMAQRKELGEALFPDPKVGTQHYDLGSGYKVTFVHKMDTKLDAAAYSLIQPELEAMGEDVKALLSNVITYKPSLVMKGYESLTGEVKDLFDEAITLKPASPSMKLIVPKQD